MSLPVCPNCKSGAVIWQHDRLPHGHNLCTNCGHIAPVRDFHPDPEDQSTLTAMQIMAKDIVKLPMTIRRGNKTQPTYSTTQPTRKLWWQE